MQFSIKVNPKQAFWLTPEDGARIREAITSQITTSFRYYVNHTVGLQISNITNSLNGNRKITLDTLIRLLSGTRIELSPCLITFTLENTSGGIVPIAGSPIQDAMLSSHAEPMLDHHQDELQDHSVDIPSLLELSDETEPSTPNQTPYNKESNENPNSQAPPHPSSSPAPSPLPSPVPSPASSPSVKPLEKLRTARATRSWEKADESSDSSGNDSQSQ